MSEEIVGTSISESSLNEVPQSPNADDVNGRWLSDRDFRDMIERLPTGGRYDFIRLFTKGCKAMNTTVARFCDKEQRVLEERPLPDGSNLPGLPNDRIKRTFRWYRDWLRFLHHDSLFTPPNDVSRFRELENLSARARVLWREERWSGGLNGMSYREGHEGIQDIRQNLWEGFNKLKKNAMAEALHPVRPSRKEIVESHKFYQRHILNLFLQDEGEYFMKLLQESVEGPSLLLGILVGLDDHFNQLMFVRHVEDAYYAKRLRLLTIPDELNLSAVDAQYVRAMWGPHVPTIVTKIQKSCRDLFDFRALRDWGWGRPWEQLHLVLDPAEDEGQVAAVETAFLALGTSQLLSDIWGFHPCLKNKIAPGNESCIICVEDFEAMDWMLTTRCNHFFHVRCIIRYWDQEQFQDYPCPMCRQAAPSLQHLHHVPNERDSITDDEIQRDNDSLVELVQWIGANPGVAPRNRHQAWATLWREARRQVENRDKEVLEGNVNDLPQVWQL
ncbi:MAG: hypothetical protein M1833_002804 [Piccolia ochrophora]|nr:MAG: hypothetical protein M1833_002804 [Piccolia ochrophora]